MEAGPNGADALFAMFFAPLEIEGRLIPRRTVNSFLDMVESIEKGDGDVKLIFPSSGENHDLVRYYRKEFFDALRIGNVACIDLLWIERDMRNNNGNNFDQLFWNEIGSHFGSMTNLKKVHILRTLATDWMAVCSILSQLTNVETIMLTSGMLNSNGVITTWSAEDLASFSHSLQALKRIKVLNIWGSLIPADNEPMDDFLRALKSLDSLSALSWRTATTELGEDATAEHRLQVSPTFLEEMTTGFLPPNLSFLTLESWWSDPSFEHCLAKSIANAPNLDHLYVDDLECYSNPCRVLDSLGQNHSLTKVELNLDAIKCDLNNKNDNNPFQFLTTNKSIRHLHLNRMDDASCWDALGLALGQHTGALWDLNIYTVSLEPQLLMALLPHLKHNTTVESLWINAKRVTALLPSQEDDEEGISISNSLRVAAQGNYAVASFRVAESDDGPPLVEDWFRSVWIVSDLNRYGRRYLLGTNKNLEQTINVLDKCQPSLDHLYMHLREYPDFIHQSNHHHHAVTGAASAASAAAAATTTTNNKND